MCGLLCELSKERLVIEVCLFFFHVEVLKKSGAENNLWRVIWIQHQHPWCCFLHVHVSIFSDQLGFNSVFNIL